MANETVKITNMPDGGSPERVALDLMQYIVLHDDTARLAKDKEARLDLYAECLETTLGRRRVKS